MNGITMSAPLGHVYGPLRPATPRPVYDIICAGKTEGAHRKTHPFFEYGLDEVARIDDSVGLETAGAFGAFFGQSSLDLMFLLFNVAFLLDKFSELLRQFIELDKVCIEGRFIHQCNL